MTNGTSLNTAIVFASDEGYFFLARGLVLSLAEAGYPNGDTKLVLIDIGCGPESLSWMKEHGVEIVPFDPAIVPAKIMSVIKPVQRAMAVRPWLPDLLPQFEHFIWLDCDLWVQNGEVVQLLKAGANVAPDAIVLAPGNSHYNSTFYDDIHKLLNMQKVWFTPCCEPEFASQIASSLHFSGGVWGIRRSSPFWSHWREAIQHTYPTLAAQNSNLVHLAEQIALNIAVVKSNLYLRLDPLFNFHCNAGGAMRVPGGRVVTNMMLPTREIGVIHMANWSYLRQQYFSLKLMYREGSYLTPAEQTRVTRP